MSHYGVIFPEYWTGSSGRQLRAAGKDAQLLGIYLATNRHANMIGLYRLLLDDIRHETRLATTKAIADAFAATVRADFAQYDAATAFVWVRNMARFRLNLSPPSGSLDPDDNRVAAVNRIYHALDPNPFLGSFFDLNKTTLRLKKRRESSGLVVSLSAVPNMSGLQGPPKPLVSQITDQQTERSGTRYQRSETRGSGTRQNDQKKAVAAPRILHKDGRHADAYGDAYTDRPADNVGVITKIAHEAIDLTGAAAPDLAEHVKELCAKYRVAYDSGVVRAAIESAIAQRHHRRAARP